MTNTKEMELLVGHIAGNIEVFFGKTNIEVTLGTTMDEKWIAIVSMLRRQGREACAYVHQIMNDDDPMQFVRVGRDTSWPEEFSIELTRHQWAEIVAARDEV